MPASPHVRTVDLQVVHRQRLQVCEGREARAEIVEREAAAEVAELADEGGRAREVRDRGGLGDLEAHAFGRRLGACELLHHEVGERGVAEAHAGEVDAESWRVDRTLVQAAEAS